MSDRKSSWSQAQSLPNLDDGLDVDPTARMDMGAQFAETEAGSPSVKGRTDAPQVGDVLLGAYRIERELGRGGMGVVYAASHPSLGEVAVKVLLDRSAPADIRARFVIEARVATRLVSEHVCRVHDVGIDEGFDSPCIVMEHLIGSDLDSFLRRRGPLPLDEAAGYVIQAVAGLAPAHELGVVHRDVKLSNLFRAVGSDGRATVKVLDFGISKAPGFGGVAHMTKLTQTGATLGSPVYMAPEQIRDPRSVDARADVWSLGIVLHELLTGALPFEAESVPELFAAILKRDPIPLRVRRPDVSAEIERVVARALQKERANRFPDARALAAALTTAVAT